MSGELILETAENTVRPWVRYWARSFDFALYYLITLMVLLPLLTSLGWGLLFAPIYMLAMYGVFFLTLLIEAGMLSTWGTTPGKWMLRVQVCNKEGQKLTYTQALKRSGDLWFRGLALGFPLINVLTMITAFFFLKKKGQSSWDRDGEFRVLHQPISLGRWVMTLLVVLALPVGEFLINLFYATVTVVIMGALTLTTVVLMGIYHWISGG